MQINIYSIFSNFAWISDKESKNMKQIDMQQMWVKFIFIKHYIKIEKAYHTVTVSEKNLCKSFALWKISD